MELMFIVWLVSVLSNIKEFVSSYTLLFVIVAVAMFIASKLNYIVYLVTREDRVGYGQIADRSTVTLKSGIERKGDGVVLQAGSYEIDKYSTYCYLVSNGKRTQVSIPELTVALRGDSEAIDWTAKIPYIHNAASVMYLSIGMITAAVLLPSDTTMKYMAGAYLLQTAYESETGKRVVSVGSRAIELQLNRWAQESPDLEALVQSAQSAAEAVK